MSETAPSPRRTDLPRLAEAALLVALFALLAIYVARVIWDIDVFWHIAAGRFFVDQGALADTDIFSALDPARRWITFQWGYEVLVYGLEQAGGLALVRFAHAAAMLAAFGLFWWGCRRRLGLGALASLFVLALLIVLFEDRIRVRPHVFNLLAWAALLPWLVRGPAALDRRAVIGTALIVAVWANLHAGGAFLFLVAAATLPAGAVLARLLKTRDDAAAPEQLRRALLWYAAALIPALLSPHFVQGNVQALTMLEATESAIAEWSPAWHFLAIATVAGHVVAGLTPSLAGLAWLGVVLRRGAGATERAFPPWAMLLGLALIVLSHRSVRFVYVAAFLLVLLWPWLRELARGFRPAAAALRPLGVAATLGLAVVAWDFNVTAQHGDLATAVARAFGDEALDARRFPTRQAAFLEATGFEGGIFCQANWGGYLLYRLHPQARVAADGRGNFSAQVTADLGFLYDRANLSDPAAGPAVAAIYERYPIDAVVHQHPVWPPGYRPDPQRWVQVFADRKGAIWVRNTPRGQAYLAKLQALAAAGRIPRPAGP